MITMIKKVKRCPKCASTDLLTWNDGTSGMIYTCKYCGYKGPKVMEEFIRDK